MFKRLNIVNISKSLIIFDNNRFTKFLTLFKQESDSEIANYYESRANKYYSSRIALHKAIRKKRSINKIKMIKISWLLNTLNSNQGN